MKRRNIKFLLALLVSILGAEVSAATLVGQNSDGVSIYYNFINDTEVEVTHRGSSYTDFISYYGKVVLSDQITYNGKTYSVTRISYNAFRGCTGLTSVTIAIIENVIPI